MSYYLTVLQKYAVFEGRARRAEFWFFGLFNGIISIVLGILGAMIAGGDTDHPALFISNLYGLAVLLPSLAVSVRRLHDTGRSGWWLLIGLIPIVGAVVLLVFYVQDSDSGDNEYGPNPKA